MSEHGHCPKCSADLNGGSIWQTFYDQAIAGQHYRQKNGAFSSSVGDAEKLADESAAMYGATRDKGQWGRAVGIYDLESDRTVRFKCPDCKHEWPRDVRARGPIA